ncbi:hypothetical protein [Streptomyces tritici]|uniref:hypothetical protein n=1 Tax=Streptomyces tritici TaxID=2054410 RepID=UPI003AEF7EF2
MIPGKPRGDRRAGAPLRATLLAVVLAVVAMLALASQQHVHSGHPDAYRVVGAADVAPHGHSHGAPASTDAPDGPDEEAPCDHNGVGESCLVLLFVVAALRAFDLGRGGSGRLLRVLRRWAAARICPWLGRAGDAPCLHRLSVLRC